MSKHVFIVDPSATMRLFLSEIAAEVNYKPIALANSLALFEKLKEGKHSPHLIILEWLQHGKSGVETLKILKKSEFKQVPIMVISTNPAKEHVLNALKNGACDYVAKPFGVTQMGDKIKKFALKEAIKRKEKEETSDGKVQS